MNCCARLCACVYEICWFVYLFFNELMTSQVVKLMPERACSGSWAAPFPSPFSGHSIALPWVDPGLWKFYRSSLYVFADPKSGLLILAAVERFPARFPQLTCSPSAGILVVCFYFYFRTLQIVLPAMQRLWSIVLLFLSLQNGFSPPDRSLVFMLVLSSSTTNPVLHKCQHSELLIV